MINNKVLRVIAMAIILSSITSLKAMAEPIQSQEDTERAVRESIIGETTTYGSNSTEDSSASIYQSRTIEQATKIRQEMNEILEDIQKIDSEISLNEVKLEKNKEQIASIEEDIELNNHQISLIENKIAENEKLCGKRMQVLTTMNPELEMLSSILESRSISDFFHRVDSIKQIIQFDKQILNEAKDNKDTLTKLNKQNEKAKKTVESLMAFNEKAKEDLQAKKNLANTKIEELRNRYTSLFNVNQSTDAKEVQDLLLLRYQDYIFTPIESQANYENVVRSAPGIYETPDLSIKLDFTQDDIIMYATSLLGIPYVWGGTTLDGFDCSGFVQYVYRHFGIYLPRVSQDQQNYGIEVVDESQLQPGDLIFFGSPAHHVAMYIQPGYMMEAPYTGSVIKVSPLRPYTKAMRVVDWSQLQSNEQTNNTNEPSEVVSN